jgi:hypothetical protein
MAAVTCRARVDHAALTVLAGRAAGPDVATLGGGDVALAAEPGEVEVGVA